MANVTNRVIIISADSKLKQIITEAVNALTTTEVFTYPKELSKALQLIDSQKRNIIIIDNDSSVENMTEDYLKKQLNPSFCEVILLNNVNFSIANKNFLRVIQKPDVSIRSDEAKKFVNEINRRIMAARPMVNMKTDTQEKPSSGSIATGKTVNERDKIIAIASSTGGTQALQAILPKLPKSFPPIVVVQHMPPVFTQMFATRLNLLCNMEVIEARGGEYLQKGQIMIAQGDYHMKLVKMGNLKVECFSGPKLHGVRPAADYMFESVAQICKNPIGVILTGMGSDGAKGLLQMKRAGAVTIGESEETCIVYGMPKAAKEMGALTYDIPLDQIAAKLISLVG